MNKSPTSYLSSKNPAYTHTRSCPGCQLLSLEEMTSLQEAHRFFTEHDISNLKIISGEPLGWRTRSKLAVRGNSSFPVIGLFKEGTHQIVSAVGCPTHHPSINRAAHLVEEWIKRYAIHPYDEGSGSGVLRYLQLVVDRRTAKVQLTLVVNVTCVAPEFNKIMEKLWLVAPDFWHSIWINLNSVRSNQIFSPHWQLCFGKELIWEKIAGVEVAYSAASFGQANLALFERMAEEIRDTLAFDANVVEYYAGVGAIGFAIAPKIKSVRCVELNPSGLACFEQSRSRLSPDVADRLSYLVGAATSAQGELSKQVNTVIVDPPRKGIGDELLRAIMSSTSVDTLIYISCGWNSFRREAKLLIASGWKIQKAQIYLFFPGTNHIETLAFFKKH